MLHHSHLINASTGLETAFLGILTAVLLTACGNTRQIPVETRTIYKYIDSTVITYKDSTILVEVPSETHRDYTGLLDTLKLETATAAGWAVADTNLFVLKGELRSKETALRKDIDIPVLEHIVYRDSIEVREVPVEVEITKYKRDKLFYGSILMNILSIISIIIYIFIKLKKIL